MEHILVFHPRTFFDVKITQIKAETGDAYSYSHPQPLRSFESINSLRESNHIDDYTLTDLL